MCGRYYLDVEYEEFLERYGFQNKEAIEFSPMEEIFPSNLAPVIIKEKERQLAMVKWGFKPSYMKGILINARSETVDVKPTFRKAFSGRRCVIPATGYFEWEKVRSEKIRHRIYSKERRIFSMAGLIDTFLDDQGVAFDAFTIITMDANKDVQKIHDRMPVILKEEDEEAWMDILTPTDQLKAMMSLCEERFEVVKSI